jgi:peptidoglycan/xylan/chitin deacetylase (PgdA/CDA1 family)
MICAAAPAPSVEGPYAHVVFDRGGIVRFDTTQRVIYLVFTGHEFGDGGETIRRTLRRQGIHGSFFLTGDFYRNPAFRLLVRELHEDGHYLGPHSDKHLLYVPWENRDSVLVSRAEFLRDLRTNIAALESCGIRQTEARFFLPAYEWYNDSIATWCRQEGVTLVNFTPGTSSNADYTTPDMGARYVPSDTIMSRILDYEQRSRRGMNGFLLLVHIGTHPDRTDKFYSRLDELIVALRRRGYLFRPLGEE